MYILYLPGTTGTAVLRNTTLYAPCGESFLLGLFLGGATCQCPARFELPLTKPHAVSGGLSANGKQAHAKTVYY